MHNGIWIIFSKIHFFKDRFIDSKILEIQGGGVPLAAPLKTQYANNLILVGDAARHVNPITGGGIHTALSGGYIAGQFLSSFLESGVSSSATNLKAYQDQWLEKLGHKMWKLYKIKTDIFKTKDIGSRDDMLYKTMSEYFSPNSEYKKI